MIILLDSGQLGLAANPSGSPTSQACMDWIEAVIFNGGQIYVPEIADYEVRRELLRADKTRSIGRLDWLKTTLGYLPLTTSIMLEAAELWAQSRQKGLPTADPKELDGDVILAAQALSVGGVVATHNIGHLARFVTADHWQNIHI